MNDYMITKIKCRCCDTLLEEQGELFTSFPLDKVCYCPKCNITIYIDWNGNQYSELEWNAVFQKKVGVKKDMTHEERHNNVKRHKELCLCLNDLYAKKNADYGDSFHLSFLQEGMAMPRIRLGDKYNRICSLTRGKNRQEVNDESLRDTLLDLANYALMTVLELDEADGQE